MKILVSVAADQNTIADITSTTIELAILWVLEDGQNGILGNTPMAWSTLSSATSLNAAIKTIATNDINANSTHTYNALTDQVFLFGGFVGI